MAMPRRSTAAGKTSRRQTAEERQKLIDAIKNSPTYLRAYEDMDFLKRYELRPVRLQLELLKPEMVLTAHNIRSTLVCFGSARIAPPEEAKERVRTIQKELEKKPNNKALRVKLNAAGRLLARSRYYDEARKFAGLVTKTAQADSRLEYVIVTGGGPGIMEAANRGAWEAGGKTIGLNMTLPHEQEPNPYISPELCFMFHYFALRKMHFMMRAKGLVIFPGGFGTMDELFETLTLVQTEKKRRIPVLLFGKEFWGRVINFNYLAEQGMISHSDLELFEYVETAEEAWEKIREHWHINKSDNDD